jgi:hypothetical protein
LICCRADVDAALPQAPRQLAAVGAGRQNNCRIPGAKSCANRATQALEQERFVIIELNVVGCANRVVPIEWRLGAHCIARSGATNVKRVQRSHWHAPRQRHA